MTAGREDLTVESDIGTKDADRMLSFVEHDVVPPPEPVRKPEPQEVEKPIVEGDEQPEQEVKTTYDEPEQPEPEQVEEPIQEEITSEVEEVVQEEDPLYAIRVDGKEEEVPLSELMRGYSRTADYTRKTQALSNERKTFEEDQATTRAARERYEQMLAQGEEWLKSMTPAEPDWDELRRSDPAEYAAQLTEHQQRREHQRLIASERDQLQKQNYQEHQRLLADHVKSERERLVEVLPEWKEPETAQAELNELMTFGQTVGFSPEELNQVYDHRAVVVLRKAMLYDRIQSGKPQVVKQARKAPVLRPGASQAGSRKPNASRLTRAREELRKSGSEKAAESFFFEALGSEDL